MGGEFLNLNQRNQRNQLLFQYLRDKKKKKEGGSEKGGGGENSPISPPLDPRLIFKQNKPYKTLSQLFCIFYLKFFTTLTDTYTYNTQWTTLQILHALLFKIITTNAVQDYICIAPFFKLFKK